MSKDPEILNRREKEILHIILDRQINNPASLGVDSFRHEFRDDRKVLDKLGVIQLIRRNSSQTKYELSIVGVYLTDSDLSRRIFSDIDRICDVLRDWYRANFGSSIRIDDICNTTELDKQYMVTCIDWLCDGVSMERTSDLTSEGAVIKPTEHLFDFKHYKEIPKQYLPLWFPAYFKTKTKVHATTQIITEKKLAVVGAALYILATFPDQCKSKEGIIMGSKIARLIDAKSPFLFPQYGGEPPFATDKIARIVNEYLKIPEAKSIT